jgi:probable rRNA maturation factor
VPVSIFAADEQSDQPVDTRRWIGLAEAVLKDEGVRGETEVSLLFVDETTISDLNNRFLGKEGPTDVLAFPIDADPVAGGRSPDSGGTGPGFTPSPDDAPTLLGDVVICPAVAHRNAPEHAGSYEDELALLVVHGLLHLMGMDHEDPDEAEVMEAKEREYLARHYRAEMIHPAAGPSVPDNDTNIPATNAAAGPSTEQSPDGASNDPAPEQGKPPT